MRRPRAATRTLLVAALMTLGAAGTALGQDVPPTAPTPDLALGPSVLDPPSPGGAFLRSLAVPGWGHAAIGAKGRGAFYVITEGGTWYQLIRTRLRLLNARDHLDLRERAVRASLASDGITDPDEIEARLVSDPGVVGARSLVSSRESQQEDWVALAVFLMLLSGADAYVSAHLAGFPDPIDVGVLPGPDGGVELAVRVPVPGP